jgi:transposase
MREYTLYKRRKKGGRKTKEEPNRKKGTELMKAPCIAIDVSKGSSHLQGYLDRETAFSNVKKIDHDRKGFNEILTLSSEIKKETSQDPVVVFEATGVYHRGLQSFLSENDREMIIVSPLQSAKFRKQELRTKKTDKRDCQNIAKVYFANDFRVATEENETYYTLRQLNRDYECSLNHLRKAKVNFKEVQEIVYPGFERVFFDLYSQSSLEILKKYPHPKRLSKKSVSSLCTFLMKHSSHREAWCEKKAKELLAYTDECVSGCREGDVNVDILIEQIDQVEYYLSLGETVVQKMIELARPIPEFTLIESIPGIGANLSARIVAEIGDIHRFPGPKQLVAYAGIDPIVYQSGKNEGLHLHISKKGNKRLRCLLYLAVMCCLRAKNQDTSIRTTYIKKTHQSKPMCSRAASIACANKLLRVIYGMSKTGCLYQ